AAAPLACLFQCITLQASQEVATISGVVADSSGTPTPGALVTLSGDGITTSRATTDARGRYRFPALPPNHACSVRAEGTGFRSLAYSGMFSEAGRTRTVNFRLQHPGDRDIVAVVTHGPFPYEEFIRGFETHVGVPVRVVELDRERDA